MFCLPADKPAIDDQINAGTKRGHRAGAEGKVAVTCNAAPFLVSRANEQIKVDVCYNYTNVKLFGLNAGASYGRLLSPSPKQSVEPG